MSIIQSIILGIIQGLTEFVPISSSGHLVIIRKLFNWSDQGLAFDTVLHLGTLLAVIIYFAKDWKKIISETVTKKSKLFWYIIIVTIPASLAGLFLEDVIDEIFREILWVATFFIITGLIFIAVEKYTSYRLVEKKTLTKINWKDSLIIGLFQIISLFPGISRSGATISAGMFRRLKRQEAARFSFLMATLIILGAGLLGIYQLVQNEKLNGELPDLILGFISSALVGYFAIKYLMRYLKYGKLNIFAYYLIGIGIILLIVRFFI
jgi:undecaprenyl-diphosphatase